MVRREDVRDIALTFPESVENGAAFEVGGKGFAWTFSEKVEGVKGRVLRPDVLAVRVASGDEKEALLASDPEKFFTVPHYNGFPAVLVRLAAIGSEELAELLEEAWRTRAPRKVVAAFDARVSDARTL